MRSKIQNVDSPSSREGFREAREILACISAHPPAIKTQTRTVDVGMAPPCATSVLILAECATTDRCCSCPVRDP